MNIKRDSRTGAIFNTNKEALDKYKLDRKYHNKINKLEKEVSDMKQNITTLLERIEYLEQG